MCSNFRQINDNVVTVKNDVTRTTTFSDMQKINYCSRYERGSNSTEPLSEEIINPTEQVVMVNSSETSNLNNMTNKVPAQESNDTNK